MKFSKVPSLRGEITVPGDKSISHRSVMLGAIAKGTTEITNFLQGADCLSTISCFRSMGIEIQNEGSRVLVHGKGLKGLKRISQIALAKEIGVSPRVYQDYEYGKREAQMTTLVKMADFFGVSLDYLTGRTDTP